MTVTVSPEPSTPVATAPVAPRRPTVLEAHGDRRIDDWAWVRDRHDPAVLALLEHEQRYCAAATDHLGGLRERLFTEIRSRIEETDLSVGARLGPWWYFSRTVRGLDYAIHCRVPVDSAHRPAGIPPGAEHPDSSATGDAEGAGGGPWPDEQVLLDENALAEGHTYLAVADIEVSPGHGLVAYGVDTTGDERYVLHVRHIAGGVELPLSVEGISYGIAWADDATLFYTRPDEANRPYQVWRCRLHLEPGEISTGPGELVFEEPDERFHVGVRRTKDGTHVVVELHSKVTSEAHVLPVTEPGGTFRLVAGRRQGVEYAVEHHGGHFVVLTNDGAENFRLMATADSAQGPEEWREVLAHRPDIRLEGFEVFSGHLACYERADGCTRISVIDLGHGHGDPWSEPLPAAVVVPSPEVPATFGGGANLEFDSTVLRYEYSSLVTPRSVFDLDMESGSSELRKQQRVLGGYDATAYVTERLWASAPDGTAVPISIVRRRDTPVNGSAPGLLYGYGAYEHSIDPVFSSIRLSLLDRGFVYAIAHVRGGGELGRRWYEDGKLLKKPNSFTDFVACAEHLADTAVVDAQRLVARGGSAGGLLMGAVANLAPGRLRAVVAEVPFVDCLTTMLDASLPLTVIEWEEWGDPGRDVDVYQVMKGYSPYDNVHQGRYPDMLVTGGLEDPRVGYWEPVKWAQKLRAADPANRVLCKVELEAGHGGPSGRYDAWRDEAFVLAFVLDTIGLA
ncbi:MAG TPA: S9 family peptidase [Acidimicrobiales bacterium]|nr:S9 family peptidase [Acidimicrobiales bacterium]